jgi:ATP-binding cassette subfamily C protein
MSNTPSHLNEQDEPSVTVKAGLIRLLPAFTTVAIFSFFINLLMFVSPLYMLQIYDRVITSRNVTTLIGLTVLAGALILVYALLENFRSRVFVRVGARFDKMLANRVFDSVHQGRMMRGGNAYFQCLRDLDTVREFFTGSGLIALCDAPWFPVFVFASFLLHPWFGYIALVGSAVTLLLTLLNEKLTKAQLNEASKAANTANMAASSMFRNSDVIQAMGMLSSVRGLWAVNHAEMINAQAIASDRAGLVLASTKFFRMFLQSVILGVGAYLAIQRETSPGTMIAASIIIGRALQPIELAVGSWKGFVAVRSAYGRLSELFQVVGTPPKRMDLPKPTGALQVQDLYAAAPGAKNFVLQGVSFALEPGELLGIIGPSAAGKSSLARVLMGIWPVMRGSVRLDGNDLHHWDPQKLGQHVGYLPQDVELFSGSIAENIARFQKIDSEAILKAATLAGCHAMIQQMPDGYNTQIGDGGQSLSGGQRQRIGLARALYGTPSLIVLDEPNASLDSAGEEALLEALKAMRAEGVTVIIITHKINALAVADRILVLADGQVKTFGPRDEVLGKLVAPRVVQGQPDQTNPSTIRQG